MLGRVGHNLIAAIALGALERLIGSFQNKLGRIVGRFCGHADARRDFQRADPLPGIEGSRRDALPQRSPTR